MFKTITNFFSGLYLWATYIVKGDDSILDDFLAGEPESLSVGATIERVANHWGLFIDGVLTEEYSRKADAVRGSKRRGYEFPSVLD